MQYNMDTGPMVPIASCRGVEIFAPVSGKFSFFKSPYAAHTTMSAVDIYPGGGFGAIAPSPVSGTIVDIREFRTPTPFGARDFMEYLTAIRQGDSIVRILHIRPTVDVGDIINVGDTLGILIHNGYFYFWNDAGMHVEMRQKDDYIRAGNRNPLKSRFEFNGACNTAKSVIDCTVTYADERYALLEGAFEGDQVRGYTFGGCLLDGLIQTGNPAPIDYFGLIGPQTPAPYIRSQGNRYMVSSGIMRGEILTDRKIDSLALGFSLSCSIPHIKVVPLKYGQKLFEPGEKVKIRLRLMDKR